MIWFNIRKLEDKISKNELSDKDGFNYVLAYFIISVFTMSLGSHNESAWIKLLHCVLLATITIWGLTAAYKANAEIDGKDFFKRFFAINWVIGMRMLFALFIVAFIAGIVMAIILLINGDHNMDKSPTKDWIILISVSLFEVIYYLLVINSIRRLKPVTE